MGRSGELIGRARESHALVELLDDVRGGRSRVLVLVGSPGIGKTALLQHLVGAGRPHGCTVLQATGVESEMELPFAALHQLFASLLKRLDTLPEPQRDAARTAFGLAVGTAPDRMFVGLAMLNLLAAASEEAPLLAVVDDAQWLDRESAQALTFVARRILAERFGLVFAARRSTTELAGLPRLVLGGLDDAAAHALLRSTGNAPLDERIRNRIVAETRGNPLALVEWRSGVTQTDLVASAGVVSSMPLSRQLEIRFRRRFADLPAGTQRFLTIAAAEPTGDPVTVWRAATSLGAEPHDPVAAIEAGLFEIGARVLFRHPLVRSAVYRSSALADRQAAHRALAEATDPDVDPDRRAWHSALGSPGPDDDVAGTLERSAGRARARGGLAAAAALLERSASLTLDPSQRARRALDAAQAAVGAGAFDMAAGMLASVEVAALDDMGRARLDLLRGHHTFIASRSARDAPPLLARAASRLESLDADLAQRAYLHALGAAINVGSLTGKNAIDEIAQRAHACSSSAAPNWTQSLCESLSGAMVMGPVRAAGLLRRSLDRSRRELGSADAYQWFGYACAAATELWDITCLHEFASAHVRVAREYGALSELPASLNSLAHAMALEGDLASAAALVAEAHQIGDMRDEFPVEWGMATLAGLRGNAADGPSLAALTEQARTRGMELVLGKAQWATATLHNGHGRYDKALAAGTDAFRHRMVWGYNICLHELVEAATRTGHAATAWAALERIEGVADPSGTDWASGVLARSRALLADGSEAEALYRDAIDRLVRSPVRPELARAHLLYGEWLRRENRRVDAREQLRLAHQLFTAMKMRAFTERARRELFATGETVRKRDFDSFDALTGQEALIARLAGQGLTNPEIGAQLFISPRTVEWHMRKVFQKLNIRSRRELRDAMSSLAPVDATDG